MLRDGARWQIPTTGQSLGLLTCQTPLDTALRPVGDPWLERR
jgi:hypothetical protein